MPQVSRTDYSSITQDIKLSVYPYAMLIPSAEERMGGRGRHALKRSGIRVPGHS